MILITGATGHNGSGIVKALSAQGIPVRAMVRKRGEAAAISGPNVEIVEGDFSDPASLDAALKGIEKAFLLPPVDPHIVDYQRNFIAVATRAKTPYIVKLSVPGADPNVPARFGRGHGEGDALLALSGIPHTLLKPNSFMQNMLAAAPSIKAQGVFYFPAADAAISHVDVRDIVAVAVKTLTEDGHQGKSYVITGPEALTYVAIAGKLAAAIGRDVTYVDISPDQFKENAMDMGMSEWLVDGLNELFAIYRTGWAAMVTDTIETVTKKPPISFDQFVRDYASTFK